MKKIKSIAIKHKQTRFILKRTFLFKGLKKNVKLISDYNFMEDKYNIMNIKIVDKDRLANLYLKFVAIQNYVL